MKRLLSFRELAILVILVAFWIFFAMTCPGFSSWENAKVMLRAAAFPGIMACGIGFLLISGMIDISIGRIAGLSAIVTSWLTVHGVGFELAFAAGCLTGGLVGYLNSQAVLRLRLSAFLATIASMFVCQGLAAYIANGFSIYPLPKVVGDFGTARPLGLSWAFFIFLGVALVLQWLLSGTVYGLQVKATGSDKEIAFMTEVPVRRIQISTFILCGMLAGLSGVLIMARIATGDSNIGGGYELNAITAAAIGGVSLFGYDGSMMGVIMGTLLIQVLQNGLIQIGISPYLQTAEVGLILLLAAYVDQRQRERLTL